MFHGDNTAVDQLSLQVPAGKLTVFVGSSGSGKTTALRMINRMIEPTSGTITVDGADVSRRQPGEASTGNRLRHPECGVDAAPAGDRQCRDGAGAAGPVSAGGPQGRLRGPRTRGLDSKSPLAIPRSCPEANNNASGWHAPWPPIRPSC